MDGQVVKSLEDFDAIVCSSRLSAARDLIYSNRPVYGHTSIGNFTSRGFDMFARSFCVDWSSPQCSAILVGHFTEQNQSPQLSAILRKMSAKTAQKSVTKP